MNPYIGITDFTESNQVRRILEVFHTVFPDGTNWRLHVGVMMSYKTLRGLPTKWQASFPAKEKIASIFFSHEAYNCLHYADYDANHELSKILSEAICWCGRGLNAVQLDMIWPNPGEVAEAIHRSRINIEVILQLGANALAETGGDPAVTVNRLRDYEGVIHRVLIDKSMGRGLVMDANVLLPFVSAIRQHFPTLGIGVAGGLGPGTVEAAQPLLRAFPDLSIDAQGRLRPSGNALDPIDWDIASEYLVQAASIIRE